MYLLSFLASPSGRFAMLDGAENMDLARQIATGTLPPVPFYRAMLYPAVLSLFIRTGVPPDWLPVAAGALGLIWHLASTLFVYRIARRTCASARAGLLAAALFGLNPVAVYFAAEPLDTTLGLFLFLAGLDVLHRVAVRSSRPAHAGLSRSLKHAPQGAVDRTGSLSFALSAAIGTGCWSLALLARPHYAIVLAGLPLVFLVLCQNKIILISILSAQIAVMGGILGSAGLIQKHICGKFLVLPTQGAYSLWVGNRPGANGRYYEQQLHLPATDALDTENPARVESELLYRQETGEGGPLNIQRMNSYWRRKTLTAIRTHPLEWLGLMTRKVYYLFNNFEQYNNKTFAIQKQLSPVLRWDPLGWGITFILCATALAGSRTLAPARDKLPINAAAAKRWYGQPRTGQGLAFLTAIAALYGLGVILFFVSDRFRLPLLPFLCIGAGGLAQLSFTLPGRRSLKLWRPNTHLGDSKQILLSFRRYIPALLAAALAGLLTFSRAWGVYDIRPAVQDYILLSIAAGKAGDDWQGLRWARFALRQRPDHPDALACAVTSFYNLKLRGVALESEFPDETWALQCQRVVRIPQPATAVRLVQAIAWWKIGAADEARNALRALQTPVQNEQPTQRARDDALGVLLLAGLGDQKDQALAEQRLQQTKSFYLLVAISRHETNSLPPNQRSAASEAEPIVRNLFP